MKTFRKPKNWLWPLLLGGTAAGLLGLLVTAHFRWRRITNLDSVLVPSFHLPKVPDDHLHSAQLPDFPEKRWLHRVDSKERLGFALGRYAGVEIDVAWNQSARYLEVGHPPTPSIGLSLQHLVGSLTDPGKLFYWLDIKGLTRSNVEDVLAALGNLCSTYGIKSHLILESENAAVLPLLARAGFYTALYLPTGQDYYRMTDDQLAQLVRDVRRTIDTSNPNALSAEARLYPIIHTYFPECDLVLWSSHGRIMGPFLNYRRVLADPKVKILLVDQASPGYR